MNGKVVRRPLLAVSDKQYLTVKLKMGEEEVWQTHDVTSRKGKLWNPVILEEEDKSLSEEEIVPASTNDAINDDLSSVSATSDESVEMLTLMDYFNRYAK